MSDVQTGYAEINGARMYYEVAGAGQTLTFIHAGVADSRLWDAQFAAFAPRYHVIRYDLRGLGRTTAPAMSYSHADDLHALLTYLRVERTALIACSMGATTALDFVLAHPQMALALVTAGGDPSGYMPQGAPPPLILELIAASQAGDAEKMAALAVQIWAVGERRKPEQVAQKVRDLVYEMSLIGFKNQVAGFGQEEAPKSPAIGRLKEVHVPTLVIDGAEDWQTTIEAGNLMAQGIAGARRVIMPNTAHLPSIEHPDEFTKIVADFLGEVLR